MKKDDYRFWEINVDPHILESVVSDPRFLSGLLNDPDDKQHDAEKEHAKVQAIEQVRKIIRANLTPRQRQIVELHFYQGRTQQEISEILGVSQQVVSKHLFGALRNGRKIGGAINKLRKLCRTLGIDPSDWL